MDDHGLGYGWAADQSRPRRLVYATLLLVFVAAVLSGCGEADRADGVSAAQPMTEEVSSGPPAHEGVEVSGQPDVIADGRETVQATSLDELISVSDLVLIGQIADVTPGRIVGDEGDTIRFRELAVDVIELLSGSYVGEDLLVEEEGISERARYSINGAKWGNVGDRAIFFLVNKGGNESQYFRLTSTQGRFFMRQNHLVPNRDDDRLSFDVGLLSPEALRERVLNSPTRKPKP